MEVAFVLMEPYHRLLRKQTWTPSEKEYARYLNETEDLSWTQLYRGLILTVHMVAVELDYRLRGRNHAELSELRELEYLQIYHMFEQNTVEENRVRRRDLFYLCSTPALIHRLLQEEA